MVSCLYLIITLSPAFILLAAALLAALIALKDIDGLFHQKKQNKIKDENKQYDAIPINNRQNYCSFFNDIQYKALRDEVYETYKPKAETAKSVLKS